MRATDILRQVLDLIDGIEDQKSNAGDVQQDSENPPVASRFKQIVAMLDTPNNNEFSNTPNEIVAPISAVTTLAGGGINGPKHPADIRVKDPSAYPNRQEY